MMSQSHKDQKILTGPEAHFTVDGDLPGMPAWTEIEEGRYMPRRVRGSYHGRALG